MQKVESNSRNDVGLRFKQFRTAIHKAQYELAAELNITQSTIANIEGGKAFPHLFYLNHLYFKYRLNTNWLLTGQGDVFMKQDDLPDKYAELLHLLQVPFIAQTLLAKLVETKALLKDNINDYFDKKEKEEKEEID